MTQATVQQKHSTMQTCKEEVYGVTPAQCQKVKGICQSSDKALNPSPGEWPP